MCDFYVFKHRNHQPPIYYISEVEDPGWNMLQRLGSNKNLVTQIVIADNKEKAKEIIMDFYNTVNVNLL